MAVCHLFLPSILIIFLFVLLLSDQTACSRPAGVDDPPSRRIERLWSFKHLEGSKRGDKREGIQTVKQYLQRYGYYMNNSSYSYQILTSDEFDQILESSLKDFQRFYNLNVTGMLDEATASLMSTPRCGVPYHPHIHPNYVLRDNERWEFGNMTLHYIVLQNQYSEEPITSAFNAWAAVSDFTFERVREESFADITMKFVALDGPGHVWGDAKTWSLPINDAVVRFDSEDCWSTFGPDPDCVHFESVATHEIGHVLGLEHTQLESANMYAFISRNTIKPLTQDDIDGVKARYQTPWSR